MPYVLQDFEELVANFWAVFIDLSRDFIGANCLVCFELRDSLEKFIFLQLVLCIAAVEVERFVVIAVIYFLAGRREFLF